MKFYPGFSIFALLPACFNFLGTSVHNLNYWVSGTSEAKSAKKACGRKRLLTPLNEFFLVRLRLGLFGQDLALRFGASQPTVSHVNALSRVKCMNSNVDMSKLY